MANFSYADVDKHNFAYIRSLLDKIEAGEPVKVGASEKIFDKSAKVFTDIRKLLDANQSPTSLIKQEFKEFTKIDKMPFSGKSGGRKIAVTDEQEQGVILWLDILVNQKKEFGEYENAFSQLLTQYKPKNARLTAGEVDHLCKWLQSDNDWNITCFYSAQTILNHFGKADLKKRSFHQNTSEFNGIRAIGKTLSKISPDKWNPQDIYLLDRSFVLQELQRFQYLAELNEFIGKHDQVIGISLKKQYIQANHGKAALNNISKIKSHVKPGVVTSGIRNKNSLSLTGKKLLSDLASKIMKMRLGFDVITRQQDGDSLLKQLDKIDIKQESFEKSIPIIMKWISDHKDGEDLDDSITYLVAVAMQKNPLSCAHMKCYGTDKNITEVRGVPEVKILRMRLKLTGDIDVIFDVEADGHPYKAQIRQFGSMPQLELKKIDNIQGWTKAKL